MKSLVIVVLLAFSGCSIRVLNFGTEYSDTDRGYSIGYTNKEKKDDK